VAFALAVVALGVTVACLVLVVVCRAAARVDELQREAEDTRFI
jgi:hypothetical protein